MNYNDAPALARKLKVAHILEGSVRKAGNQVRITAQLAKAALAIDPDYVEAWASLSVTYLSLAQSGYLDDAIKAYGKLLELNPEDWGSNTQVAIILLQLDKPEQAYQEHSGLLTGILKEPLLKPLHDDPRWGDLLKRMNFPD